MIGLQQLSIHQPHLELPIQSGYYFFDCSFREAFVDDFQSIQSAAFFQGWLL